MHDLDSLSATAAERLRALPDEAVEPYGWEEFKRRAARGVPGDPRGAARSPHALRAAAAVLLVSGAAAFAVWMWGGFARPVHLSTDSSANSSMATAAGASGEAASPAGAGAREMERWLARQPADPAMVRVGSYAAVAGLEDRIAQLDDLLTTARAEGVQSANLSPLEKQRARLMSSLAQVRYADTLVADSPP